MNTDEKKKITLADVVHSRALQKRFKLFKCKLGTEHLYDLIVPHRINENLFDWYDITLGYKFKGRKSTYVSLLYECVYCKRNHHRRAKLCKECGKVQGAITKKLKDRVITLRRLECECTK